MRTIKQIAEEAPARCKYCGAILRRDAYGLRCPTHNCQWEYDLPQEADDESSGG